MKYIVYYSEKKLSIRQIALKFGKSTQFVLRRLDYAGTERREYQGSGSNHSQWKGGRFNVAGYIRVMLSENDPFFCMATSNGYVLEHRLNMARKNW